MTLLIIVLRILHLFGGVLWVGFGFFNIRFLQPAIRATGTDGQKVMQYLSQKTRLQITISSAATLTILSGLILYWVNTGFRAEALTSGPGLVLGIGGIAGITGWAFGILVIPGIFRQMALLSQEIQAKGGTPTAEQTSQMQALGGRLGRIGRIALTFALLSLLAMSVGRYVIL